MQRWIMLLILWANASASRYYLYPDHRKQHHDEAAAVPNHPTSTTTKTVLKLTPYNKHHPGRHVCAHSNSNASNPVIKTNSVCCKPTYKKYMVRCGNQWCSGVRLVYEHYNKQVVGTDGQKSDITYYCCPGWTQVTSRSHGCNRPVCPHGCQNGGVCSRPGLCSCPPGYNGTYCEYKQQVFTSSDCGCLNGASCENRRCICPPGFQGDRCEEDIDECKSRKPCDQICRNTKGSYSCDCRENFALQPDRHSCRTESKSTTTTTCRSMGTQKCLLDGCDAMRRRSRTRSVDSCRARKRKEVSFCGCEDEKAKKRATEMTVYTCCNLDLADNDESGSRCRKSRSDCCCDEIENGDECCGDTDNAIEASDMGRQSIEQRLATLEQFIREKARNEITRKDLGTLHENMAIIARNVKAMKTQLCKMEDLQTDIEDIKDKIFELEEKTKKLEMITEKTSKCPQSIVKICTNHSGSSSS